MNEKRVRFAPLLAGALALTAGFADADAYLRWHQFAANMTGNTVLFGIAAAGGNATRALVALAPIAAFVAGAALAEALLRASRPAAFLVEATLIGAASFAAPHRWQLDLVAAAMAIQNATAKSFGNVEANTSFVTGDYGRIASAAVKLALRSGGAKERETLAIVVPLVAAYAFGGAAAAGLAAKHVPHALLAVVPVVLGVAVALGRRRA